MAKTDLEILDLITDKVLAHGPSKKGRKKTGDSKRNAKKSPDKPKDGKANKET